MGALPIAFVAGGLIGFLSPWTILEWQYYVVTLPLAGLAGWLITDWYMKAFG